MSSEQGSDDHAQAYWRERLAECERHAESQPEELPVAGVSSIRPSEHPTKKGLHVIRRLLPELLAKGEVREAMIDPAEIASLRTLEAKATEAPWIHGADDEPPHEDIDAESGGAIAFVMPYAYVPTALRRGESFNRADARLIAAGRNALPRLLDAAERCARLEALLREAIALPHMTGELGVRIAKELGQ